MSQRGRSLTREVVAQHVQEIIGTHVQTLHGFEWDRWPIYINNELNSWRLQSGGGIAGNSRVWWLVQKAGGNLTGAGPLRTVKELRRALLEHLVTEGKPQHGPEWITYARRQPNGSVCWETRRKRRGSRIQNYLRRAEKIVKQLQEERKVTVESQTTGYGKNG